MYIYELFHTVFEGLRDIVTTTYHIHSLHSLGCWSPKALEQLLLRFLAPYVATQRRIGGPWCIHAQGLRMRDDLVFLLYSMTCMYN